MAGTFTTNLVKAAPVKWDRSVVDSGIRSQAVIVNSGIANACTGEEGMNYCAETAKEAAKVLGVDEKGRLDRLSRRDRKTASMDRVKEGIHKLAEAKKADLESGTQAAQAVMTTDTKKKKLQLRLKSGM